MFFNQNGFISCKRQRVLELLQVNHGSINHLDDNSLNNVKIIPSKVPFKFGDS